jgi:hypothetical protein
MTNFVFDPPLRLARDVTVRTLDDAAEFARTFVGPRLPHRRDRLVRRLQEVSDNASARIAARSFLEVVSDPIVRFELALKTSNVFDMTVRPSCRDSPALCFGVPDLRRWSQRTSVLGHGRGFAASIRGRCFCGSNALCLFLFHPLFGR